MDHERGVGGSLKMSQPMSNYPTSAAQPEKEKHPERLGQHGSHGLKVMGVKHLNVLYLCEYCRTNTS